MGLTLHQYLSDLSHNDLEKAGQKLWSEAGGEKNAKRNLELWRKDKIRVQFEEPRFRLFDKRGWRILPDGMYPSGPMKKYRFQRPRKHDFEKLVETGKSLFPDRQFPSSKEVEDTCLELEEQLGSDPAVSALVRVGQDRGHNVRLPWVLPQLQIDPRHPGAALMNDFIPSLKAAYEDGKSSRKFHSDVGRALGNRVSLVDRGQLRLVLALAKGPVCGWIFPDALRGVSVKDQRQQMLDLFQVYRFCLGGFDALAATAQHPEVLCAHNAPVLALAAFKWKTRLSSLALAPGREDSDLWLGGILNSVHGDISGTLSVFKPLR